MSVILGSCEILVQKVDMPELVIGKLGIMVSICAHVPMSLWARTSVPDDRSEIKATEKVWF